MWHLRWHWLRDGPALYEQVLSGRYRLSPMMVCGRRDALVLKWVALNIQSLLPRPVRCMHLRGKGSRRSLQLVSRALRSEEFEWVHRTDIRGYYAQIRKDQVMSLVRRFVKEPVLISLTDQYVHYSVEDGGDIRTPVAGIPRGCALSPLIGGALLWHVDGHFTAHGHQEAMFYARYMDDFLLFTRTRWQLRRAIRQLAEFFDLSGFERHPDKTQTGRLSRGFDWLGIWFGADGATISPRSLNNHRERSLRLYEQARGRGLPEEMARARVQAYEARWTTWADGMLRCVLPDE